MTPGGDDSPGTPARVIADVTILEQWHCGPAAHARRVHTSACSRTHSSWPTLLVVYSADGKAILGR